MEGESWCWVVRCIPFEKLKRDVVEALNRLKELKIEKMEMEGRIVYITKYWSKGSSKNMVKAMHILGRMYITQHVHMIKFPYIYMKEIYICVYIYYILYIHIYKHICKHGRR